MTAVSLIAAVVPAAGESRRMGRPKLLIQFGGLPLIGRVVKALREGGADPVHVVVPPAHAPEGPAIADAAHAAGGRVIVPEARPADMRASVELGLAEMARERPPAAVLLTPADSPALTADIVVRLIAGWRGTPEKAAVAFTAGRRAHPCILPWDLAVRISSLPSDRGVDHLLRQHADRIAEIEVDRPGLADDLNTPRDLDRWRDQVILRPRVRLFAVARERAGRAAIEVTLPPSACVADLRRAISEQYPELSELAARVPIAIDSDYAADDRPILAGSELALIPPVSGGQGTGSSR